MVDNFIDRKHGNEAISYPDEKWQHESLQPILEPTYGIILYQEQVMQIAQKMAGYSLGAADLLRRAMGKKIRAEMDKQRETFTEGATGRGIPKDKAVEVFDLMAKFADYGFNKSHAAAYALVSYQTAWMKANYPVPFLAACMSLARERTEKLAALRQEAERLGIRVLPPNINSSDADFTVEKQEDGQLAIRYALAAVKKVGFAAMQGLTESRGKRPFQDLADFAARVDPRNLNKMQLENLARAGAFDTLEANRSRVFSAIETILKRAHARAQEEASGQAGLFGGPAEPEPLRLSSDPDWPEFDRLSYEAEAIGFHMTGHPLDSYRPLMRRLGVVPMSRLLPSAEGGVTRVKIAGCVVDRKERPTRSGSKMAWVQLSDASGSCEVTLFSEVLGRVRDILVAGRAVLVTADLKLEGEALRITASDVVELEEMANQTAGEMRIWVERAEAVSGIQAILSRQAGGRGRVCLLPRVSATQEVEIRLKQSYRISPVVGQALKTVAGVTGIEIT